MEKSFWAPLKLYKTIVKKRVLFWKNYFRFDGFDFGHSIVQNILSKTVNYFLFKSLKIKTIKARGRI